MESSFWTSFPKIGLGTWQMKDGDALFKAISELGYRHINTGYYYQNDEMIGQALK